MATVIIDELKDKSESKTISEQNQWKITGDFTPRLYGAGVNLNRKREYINCKKNRIIEEISLLGYISGSLVIYVKANESTISKIKEAFVGDPILSFPKEYRMKVQENESGLERISDLIDYIHTNIEQCPKDVRFDMKKTLGIKKLALDDEIYDGIQTAVKNKQIDMAFKLAEKALYDGYPRANYMLGVALHDNLFSKEAFNILTKVDKNILDDFSHANEILADLVLCDDGNLDDDERYALAFKHLCLGGDNPSTKNLKQRILNHYTGGNGLLDVDVVSDPVDMVLILSKKTSTVSIR